MTELKNFVAIVATSIAFRSSISIFPQTIAYIEGVLAPLRLRGDPSVSQLRLRFLRRWHGRRACHGDSRRYGCAAHCRDNGAAFASTHPGKMHACATMDDMAMALCCRDVCRPYNYASSRAPLSAMCSLCSSRPRNDRWCQDGV